MSDLSATTTLMSDIEARQDDLLRQLDELEKKIARVLADYAASCQAPPKPAVDSPPAASESATAPAAGLSKAA